MQVQSIQLAVVHIAHPVLNDIPESAASATTNLVLRTSVVTLECPRCMWAGAVASLPSVVTSRERPCSPPARRVTSHVHPLRRRGAEPAGSAIGDPVQGKHEPRRRFGVQPWGSNEGGGLGPVLPDSTGTRACTMEWTRHVKETAREIREIRPARARGNTAQARSGRASQVHQTCAFARFCTRRSQPAARLDSVVAVCAPHGVDTLAACDLGVRAPWEWRDLHHRLAKQHEWMRRFEAQTQEAAMEPRARTEVVEPVSSQTQPACAERRSALDVHISWGSP
ncbi:hypothetical protein B0H19DRAFT_1383911 [Mycena capillaripes]|nr:hypothetical protein B0H19DRAFT_1383911 [Mycena capillaripes]